jgi:hypothetical protein
MLSRRRRRRTSRWFEVARFITKLTRVLAILCAGTASAATNTASPNFAPNSGVGWVAFAPRFINPPDGQGPGPVGEDPDHPRVSNADFRTSGQRAALFPMGDSNSPILQPWAREKMREYNERVLSGKAAFNRQSSCWPVGVPHFLLYPVQPVYFIQTPEKVVMIWQADHQVRHVYLNVKHSAQIKLTDYGESVGHYEGDTLVVDTIGLHPRTDIDNYETPHTDQLHVIERFRMTQGGDILEVNVHVEDPGAFTTPWNAIQRYNRIEPGRRSNVREAFSPVPSTGDPGPMIESSCAESPNTLFGAPALPLPQAEHPDF